MLITVVETAPFTADAKRLLSQAQRQELAAAIAEDPKAGAVIVGTGGCRKIRFALEGRGKSGSVRVVYSYNGPNIPVFLFAIFAKNEKINLTDAEKNALAKVVKRTAKTYGVKK